MNGFKFKLGAMALAAVMAFSPVVPAFAADGTDNAETPAATYEVSGTSCNFNKYLIMDEGDSVPNVTFSFKIEGAKKAPTPSVKVQANEAGKAMEILEGVGAPTIADVTFAPDDATATAAGSNIDVARSNKDRGGAEGADAVQLDAGEKYATKQATIDFSSVKFTEPGIYRYIVTENESADHAAAGIIHDTDKDRILDVYVTDDGTGKLVVSGYVMHTDFSVIKMGDENGSGDVATTGEALKDKTDGFTNEYASKDLKIEKEVSGNQASRDKYFEFTVTATDVADADSYVVSLADDSNAATNDGNADATSGAAKPGGTIEANANKANPTTVTGAQLKAGQKFYLKHGQSIVIRGLAQNASYTVTENAEDYKSDVKNGDTNSGVIGTVTGNDKMAVAGFTNTRNGVVPTGIFLYGGIGVAVVGLAGLMIAVTKKNKKAFN